MFVLGSGPRYIDFRLVDIHSEPITGKTLDDLTVLFLRDNVACADQLALTELSEGRYSIIYVPSSVGHDYLEIRDEVNDVSVLDIEDIVDPANLTGGVTVINVDENYGGTGNLLVNEGNAEQYRVYLYPSHDWDAGRRLDSYAMGSAAINADGTWGTKVSVPEGTYHIVLRGFRITKVLRPYVKVEVPRTPRPVQTEVTSVTQGSGIGRMLYDIQPPLTGTFSVGDRVINIDPKPGGNEGWICVTAGTPGSWKAYGSIAE